MSITSLISKTKAQVFNPLIGTLDETIDFLKSIGVNSCHPHPKDNSIVFLIDNNIQIVKNDLPYSHFVSHGSMAMLEKKQFELFKKHEMHLGNILGYSTNILFPGSCGKVKISGAYQIFAVTDKQSGQYFDLQAFINYNDTFASCHYNSTLVNILQHSGDLTSQGSLLHTIGVYPTNETHISTKFLVTAVGYSKSKLVDFENQHPIIVIVDHESNVINIVPFPLDHATLGNSTMASILQCEVDKENSQWFIKFKVLEQLVKLPNVNTGETSAVVKNAVLPTLITSVNLSDTKAETPDLPDIKVTSTVDKADMSVDDSYTNFTNKSNVIEFVQSDKFTPLFDTSTVIPFGTNIGSFSDKELVLPVLFGNLEGHQSVLLGNGYSAKINKKQYFEVITNSHVIVHLETNGWNAFSANTIKNVGNCLYIVHMSDTELKKIDSTPLYFLPMIGSKSVILIECKEKYYYYRGINRKGIPKSKFGNEIKPNFDEYITSPLLFPLIENKNSVSIYSPFHSMCFDIPTLLNELKNITNENDMFDVLTQITIGCDSKTVTEISSIVIESIENQINNKVKFVAGDYEADVKLSLQNNDLLEIVEKSKQINKIKKEISDQFTNLLEFINTEMVSVKGCVSKNHSLERVKRKNEIKKNVVDVLTMNTQQLVAEQADACDEYGFVICNVLTNKVLKLLTILNTDVKSVEKGKPYTIKNFVKVAYDNMQAIVPNKRCIALDGLTYSSISEIVSNKHKPFSGSGLDLVLPIIGDNDGFSENDGTLPIPLYSKLVKISNPYLPWNDLANDPIIAHYRIALRNMLIKATCSRDFEIPVDNRGLGAMCCIVLLRLLEDYVSPISSENISMMKEGDTTLNTIRGLLGFILTFMASGVNSQITAWELFRSDNKLSVPDNVEIYDVYIRLLKVAKYAKWDLNLANKKMAVVSKKFLVAHPEVTI